MEARAGKSIFDFETLFSDFQELLNGSGLTPVAGSIFRPLSQTHISEREFKKRPYLQILLCFQVISGKNFSAEEVDLSFKSETKEHPQISDPSFWKRDRENLFLQML